MACKRSSVRFRYSPLWDYWPQEFYDILHKRNNQVKVIKTDVEKNVKDAKAAPLLEYSGALRHEVHFQHSPRPFPLLEKGGRHEVRKGVRRMPWLSQATKDVISCDKLRGGANGL